MVAGGWGGFKNGQIPLTALTHVFGPFYLRADVAAQLNRMLDDYAAQNPGRTRPHLNSAYRSLADQQYQLDHPHGQAIAPVGESTHGWAITGDLSDTGRNPLTRFSAWLDDNAHLYGFKRTIASESWHYQGGFPATIIAGNGGTALEEDMPLTPADIGLLLNSAAFDGGPSISVVLKTIHDELLPVQRVEGLIPVRQDNADTKTIAIRLEARLAALTAASTAAAAGATTTQVQAAAKAGAEEALAALSLTISTKP